MKETKTVQVAQPELNRLRRVVARLRRVDGLCACGNYYTSKRCAAGSACDLGHKEGK